MGLPELWNLRNEIEPETYLGLLVNHFNRLKIHLCNEAASRNDCQ